VKALLFGDETYQIRGACYEVYKEKGSGFVEPVYQECVEIEFNLRGIGYVSQPKLRLDYKGQALKAEYVPDMICFEKIIVELKAVTDLTDQHRAQVHNYLKASGHRLGLLINFGHHPKIQIERIIR
jgi:GxxExxY protein